jgi:alkanesulfonate monooxygenase SsuD/methylene tetrahydromethanopterin reductase-like flavin-dependent oxidoreductase (luciferase family)
VRFGIDIRPIVGVDDDAVEAVTRRIIRVAPVWTFGESASSRDERRHVLAAMTRAHGSADPFVGTVDVIARRIDGYRAAGVDVFHMRGFDPLADVITHSAVVDAVHRLAHTETITGEVVGHVA